VSSESRLILYLGADWWGSDARALAVAMRRSGHRLIEANCEDYFPQWSSTPLKIVRRLMRPLCVRNFNDAVAKYAQNAAIDFVLVFKGMMLLPDTLAAFQKARIPVYCFYPDVSFLDHGGNIWQCLSYYTCLFTTKSFHLSDERLRSHVKTMQFVSHGYDPEVHRLVPPSEKAYREYACDASFVGCWSPKKEALIAKVLSENGGCDVNIWGPGWNRSHEIVRRRWKRRGAYGDELALIYQTSTINLGLLSEAGGGVVCGDQTTVRTWQIPATGGFLLHENTAELGCYFDVGREVAVFKDAQDLPRQVQHFLGCPEERLRIAEAGHQRCLAEDYTYARSAAAICEFHDHLYATQ
jgi:spore maturation protein CgeB